MKKHFMISVVVEIDAENEINSLNEVDYSVKVESPDVKMNVIGIPEAYEFTL